MCFQAKNSPGFFKIFKHFKEKKIYVCSGSHPCAYYHEEGYVLIQTLEMKPLVLPIFSSAEHVVHHNLRYHVSFVPDDNELRNLIEFSYVGSLTISYLQKISPKIIASFSSQNL